MVFYLLFFACFYLIFSDTIGIDSTYEETIFENYIRKVWIVLAETLTVECNTETLTVYSRQTADDEYRNRSALIEKMDGSQCKISLNETDNNTTEYCVYFNRFANAYDPVGFYKLETKQGN